MTVKVRDEYGGCRSSSSSPRPALRGHAGALRRGVRPRLEADRGDREATGSRGRRLAPRPRPAGIDALLAGVPHARCASASAAAATSSARSPWPCRARAWRATSCRRPHLGAPADRPAARAAPPRRDRRRRAAERRASALAGPQTRGPGGVALRGVAHGRGARRAASLLVDPNPGPRAVGDGAGRRRAAAGLRPRRARRRRRRRARPRRRAGAREPAVRRRAARRRAAHPRPPACRPGAVFGAGLRRRADRRTSCARGSPRSPPPAACSAPGG